jgi:hypothetical protein
MGEQRQPDITPRPLQRRVMPVFGSIITATVELMRSERSENRVANGRNELVHIKYWKKLSIKVTGLFIGFRTLYDGTVTWAEYEGTTFKPESQIRAALIVPSARRNPVYVLRDSIEA